MLYLIETILLNRFGVMKAIQTGINSPLKFIRALLLSVAAGLSVCPILAYAEFAPVDTLEISEDTLEVAVDSTQSPHPSNSDLLLRSLVFEEELLDTTINSKLEIAARLLETARYYLESDQFATAGYSFTLARMIVSMVDADALDDSTAEFYRDLASDVDHFYDDYVARSPVLPADSPPEAIIAGIEEAEGDTLPTLDEIVQIERGEVDTTALAEAISSVRKLPGVELERNRQVENAMKFFQGKGRKVFGRWLKRAEYNIPFMTKILREEGIPDELVYIAMIESGFNYTAYSSANAAGPWQFIQSTGRIFGLKINWWYDERRDPEKATRAACQYFRKLYLQFGDWDLAMASYNCGEGNVARQIRKTGQRDFWKMSKLPHETRNYVPTYIAAAIMAQNPTEYGFEPINYRLSDPVDSVWVTESVDLKLAASLVGSDYQTLKALNPWCLRWSTPPDEDLWLILPDGTADSFKVAYAAIPEDQRRIAQSIHTVRKGETLAAIAKKYGTTVSEILAVKENRIRKNNTLLIGQEIILPVAPSHYKETASEYKVAAESGSLGKQVTYKVKRGDNLSAIASKFGTTVSAIKANNRLYKSNKIFAGQKLIIQAGKSSTATASDEAPPQAQESPTYHVVKKGEVLSEIATKYHVYTKDLMRINDIDDPRKLFVGMKLKLRGSGGDEVQMASASVRDTHVVKRGDTIGKIARKYGKRESELLRANGLSKNSVIRPGEKLRIPD